MKYRAEVDGIRALAIIPVLLFHAGLGVFGGGFVGVDIFFVISGFVIAAKLKSDLAAGQFSLVTFYVRRIRRLLPALTVAVAVTYLAGLVLFLPPAMEDLARSLVATVLFSANFYFWKFSGYFDLGAQNRPLLHMWSLAVEEQFYFFIPIALFVLLRYARRFAIPILLAVALASLGLSSVLTNVAPTANFFLLPTRAWEMLAGTLLALSSPRPIHGRSVREGIAVVGLVLMLAPVFLYDEGIAFPGLSALPPVIGTVLVIYACDGGPSIAKRLLSLAPVVWIGLISYSLYLVHWPLIVFVRTWLLRNPSTLDAALIVAVSVLLAALLWHFVEKPFRHRGRVAPALVYAGAGVTLASLAAVGALGIVTKGLPARMPDFHARHAAGGGDVWLNNRCFLQNQPAASWAGRDCVRTVGARPNALLWGDSFAAHYLVGLLDNESSLTHNIVQYTFAGCPPVIGYRSYARPGCEDFNSRVLQVIKDFDIATVVIAARWDQLRGRGLSGLADTVRRLRSAGVAVHVIGQSPLFAFDTDTLRYRGAGLAGGGTAGWYPAFDPQINEQIRSLVGEAAFVDPLPTFCHADRCDYMRAGEVLYYDYGHLSARGSDLAVRSYFPIVSTRSAESHVP
jgi:peptidoglycan/LPS O-acetylase OafA/YrhL